jgi:hypothetical protein
MSAFDLLRAEATEIKIADSNTISSRAKLLLLRQLVKLVSRLENTKTQKVLILLGFSG